MLSRQVVVVLADAIAPEDGCEIEALMMHRLVNVAVHGDDAPLAIHPDQVGPINAAFTPTEAEKDRARRIVAAFAAAPAAGVVSLDGQMIDRPHLIHAQRILNSIDRKEGSS